jgi:diguanylate cyclase (GGDEF)-like protein
VHNRKNNSYEWDLRSRTTFYIALMALILLTPFSLNHLIHERYALGAGSLFVVLVLATNAWQISRGRYSPALMFYGLMPIILFFLSLALHKQGIIGVLWCYPAVIGFYFMLPEREAWISNVVLLILTIPQIWLLIDHPVAVRATVTLIAVSTFSAIFMRVIRNQQHQLHTIAVTDSLTGVHNRVLLHDTLEQSLMQGNRSGIPMTLITLDLDHFKSINDSLGHDAGDTVLKHLGKFLQESVRATDKVFRMGGEEFLMLLYDTTREGGLHFAEKIRSEIERHEILPDHQVTVSLGVAELQPGDDRDSWMRRCDQSLYTAKTTGRNKVAA